MNLDIYTEEMTKSIWDKAFFMDKIIGVKCIIDFGCADGAMIHMLANLFPETTFYGYDFNDVLIDEAWSKLNIEEMNHVFFYRADNTSYKSVRTFSDLIKDVQERYQPDEICINFSSVLHEIFSSSPSGKEPIKTLIKELKPKYITIRDMYWHQNYFNSDYLTNRALSIMTPEMMPYIEEYESHFNSILEPKELIHFLMKYQWKDNGWDEELKENYFSLDIYDFLDNQCAYDYDLVFKNHYQLPYLTEQWLKEYNIFLPEAHTHAQFILRRHEY